MFTTFDVYKLIFMAELLIAFFVYTHKLEKREKFGWRVAAVCGVDLLVALFSPVPVQNAWYTSFVFVVLFALLMATAIFCFKEKFINILYCGLAAYTTRHLAFQLYGFALTGFEFIFSIFSSETISMMYGNEMFVSFFAREGFIWFIFYVAIYVLVCCLLFCFFGRHIWRKRDLSIKNSLLLILSGIAILVDVLLHSFLLYSFEEVTLATVLVYIYNILCCLFIFYMMSNAIDMKSLDEELNMVKYLLKIQKENYEELSKNIELINIRCHDIKHQIHERLDADTEIDLKEIEDLINIYDSKIQTGNNELDIILMQKSLFCAKHKIVFSCMADGEKLSFMESADIYSLFGNIIDNAIESASKFENKDQRVIDLSVSCKGNILKVQASNYYGDNIRFDEDGLPLTTKVDKSYHGYGLKSIRMIVEKYGGDLEITAEDGIFSVCIIMECSKK